MTTPTTPAECRAEQERVLKLLSNADAPKSWYYQPGWGLQKHNADGLGLIAGQSDFATHGDLLLLEAAPTLARAYADLLAAHAEALEREAKLMKEGRRIVSDLRGLRTRWVAGSHCMIPEEAGQTVRHVFEDVMLTLDLPSIFTPPAQAPASAEGGEG